MKWSRVPGCKSSWATTAAATVKTNGSSRPAAMAGLSSTLRRNWGRLGSWLSDLPAGYIVASIREGVDHLTVGPGQTAIERAYRVRKGTIWSFRFTRGAEQKPASGFVACRASVDVPVMSRSIADEHGQALLTLPAEGLKINLERFGGCSGIGGTLNRLAHHERRVGGQLPPGRAAGNHAAAGKRAPFSPGGRG